MRPAEPLAPADLGIGPALTATVQLSQRRFLHLPSPVTFRASGALAAWSGVFDKTPEGRKAREALADVRQPISETMYATSNYLHRHIHASTSNRQTVYQPLFANACQFLSFWWRGGKLYEPTQALGTLLGETDWSQDVPMRCLRTPVPALCIVPPVSQRAACADMCSLMVFSHEPVPGMAPGACRALTVVAVQPTQDGALNNMFFSLTVLDEDEPLANAFHRLEEGARMEAPLLGKVDEEKLRQNSRFTRQVMDYVVKVLLYLNCEGAQIRELTPYSSAPRVFPGLGRRKREARLAEVEQLYDRFVLGPEHGLQTSEQMANGTNSGFEVSAHWRRGHFRLQPHGPHASLRKVMFIMPTLVRADRLAGAGEARGT